MAWLKSHDDIWEHHKLNHLQRLLQDVLPAGLDSDEQRALLVGYLHALWHFALRSAWRTADLSRWGDDGIERAVGWRRKHGAFIKALREAGLMDGYTPHGLMERIGDFVKKRLGREAKIHRVGEKRRDNGGTTAGQRRDNGYPLSRPEERRGEKRREEKMRRKESTPPALDSADRVDEEMGKGTGKKPVAGLQEPYKPPSNDVAQVVAAYKSLLPVNGENRDWDKIHFKKCLRPAGILLTMTGSVEGARKALLSIGKIIQQRWRRASMSMILDAYPYWKDGNLEEWIGKSWQTDKKVAGLAAPIPGKYEKIAIR